MNIDTIMHPRTPSKAELSAALSILMTVAETIREIGEVPSGTLYAMLCGTISLDEYQSMITTLKRAGLVDEQSHLLRWIGPLKGAK